jgi:hypothetical protein
VAILELDLAIIDEGGGTAFFDIIKYIFYGEINSKYAIEYKKLIYFYYYHKEI